MPFRCPPISSVIRQGLLPEGAILWITHLPCDNVSFFDALSEHCPLRAGLWPLDYPPTVSGYISLRYSSIGISRSSSLVIVAMVF